MNKKIMAPKGQMHLSKSHCIFIMQANYQIVMVLKLSLYKNICIKQVKLLKIILCDCEGCWESPVNFDHNKIIIMEYIILQSFYCYFIL